MGNSFSFSVDFCLAVETSKLPSCKPSNCSGLLFSLSLSLSSTFSFCSATCSTFSFCSLSRSSSCFSSSSLICCAFCLFLLLDSDFAFEDDFSSRDVDDDPSFSFESIVRKSKLLYSTSPLLVFASFNLKADIFIPSCWFSKLGSFSPMFSLIIYSPVAPCF